MVWPLTPRSLATSATFLPDAIRSRTRRLNSGGYLLGMPTSSGGHGHDESNDATPPKWGNIKPSTKAGELHSCLRSHTTGSIVGSTTAILLSEFLSPDLVEDGAVVFSFKDPQVVRTPRARTLRTRSGPPPTETAVQGQR